MAKRSVFDMVVTAISLIAGIMTVGQNLELFSVAGDSAIKAPISPFVSILGFLLIIMAIRILSRRK